jgi:hypothetical protein
MRRCPETTMSRLANIATFPLTIAFCVSLSVASHAEPQDVTLPMIAVPDQPGKADKSVAPGVVPGVVPGDRASLLRKPIELTDDKDRRVYVREQSAWRRLAGTMCIGCGEMKRVRTTQYVDPIAVLNARPASLLTSTAVTRVAAKPTVRVAHSHRVRFAHRRTHRSRFYAYYSRLRYAVLKWRRHHHSQRHRSRFVQN